MNKRFSAQKKMIEDTLFLLDHPTATEVYETIRLDYPQISLGTVYRNLNTMADDGEIVRLTLEGSPDRFDPNAHEHYHVVCTRCKRIFDTNERFPKALIQDLDKAIEQCTGLEVESRYLIFHGICPQCKAHSAYEKQ